MLSGGQRGLHCGSPLPLSCRCAAWQVIKTRRARGEAICPVPWGASELFPADLQRWAQINNGFLRGAHASSVLRVPREATVRGGCNPRNRDPVRAIAEASGTRQRGADSRGRRALAPVPTSRTRWLPRRCPSGARRCRRKQRRENETLDATPHGGGA